MALKSIICAIVDHAHRTRAHCPTMVSNFKLLHSPVCLLRLIRRAVHIRRENRRFLASTDVLLHHVEATNL